MRVVGAIAALLILGGVLGASASAERQGGSALAPAFQVRFDGSVGPLHIGMKAKDAQKYLRHPKYVSSHNGLMCAQYVMQDATRAGLVGICFKHYRLTGFSVSGPVFCFTTSACVNGKDPMPKTLRKGFTRHLDKHNGVYYAYKKLRLLNKKYQAVLEGPASDPAWSARAVGFGPCGAGSTVRFYVPVNC
jgi:hypothetical protein